MPLNIARDFINVLTISIALEELPKTGLLDSGAVKTNPVAANMLLEAILKNIDKSPKPLYSIMKVNFFALKAWEEEVHANYKDRLGELDSFDLSLRGFLGGNGVSRDRQELHEKYLRDRILLRALHDRLAWQTALTLKAGLKDIEATEVGALKESAAEVLALAAKGEDEGNFPLSKIINLAAESRLEAGLAEFLMRDSTMFPFAPPSMLQGFIYVAISELCSDQTLRDKARGMLAQFPLPKDEI